MEFSDIKGEYKQIEGFEDYFITEYGDVYSVRLRGSEKTKHLHKIKPKDPGNKSKYLNVILCNNDEQVTKSIHRLVADAFVDGYFPGAVVNHIDGNNRNNSASNLEWTDTQDNIHKSYTTSGVGPKRNYKVYELYDAEMNMIGSFEGHADMERFVKESNIDASPTQLTKKCNSRGYTLIKKPKVG